MILYLRFLLCLILFLFLGNSYAKQWGLVIGIDEYPKLKEQQQLQGAVNDAQLLAQTLRRHGVDLTENSILLNQNATVAAFRVQYANVLSQAKPGDEFIITYAGHGGQEREFGKPLDEQDGLDETLMFYDFDPKQPQQGRLSDDELYTLFAHAKDVSVLFVADSCHSGGITRSGAINSALPNRGILDTYQIDPKDYHPAQIITHDDRQVLSHVTYLAATADESKLIPEINGSLTGNQIHGALSWSVAEAFAGQADANDDAVVTRAELIHYVEKRVATLTDRRQIPGLKPRGDEAAAFLLSENQSNSPTPNVSPASPPLAIKLTGTTLPAWVANVTVQDQDYRLQFSVNGEKVFVYNPHGDKVTTFAYDDQNAWVSVIAKYRLLVALDDKSAQQKSAPDIHLAQGDGLHSLNERLDFAFEPNSPRRYFYLFDLSGTGKMQFLYPHVHRKDPEMLSQLPFQLHLMVTPPTGEDDLVAIFCQSQQPKLLNLLMTNNNKDVPESAAFMASIDNDCEFGRYQFFTSD
jgi:hypothetical protein